MGVALFDGLFALSNAFLSILEGSAPGRDLSLSLLTALLERTLGFVFSVPPCGGDGVFGFFFEAFEFFAAYVSSSDYKQPNKRAYDKAPNST